MNKSLVSIIVPCYNQAQYLDECLQSVIDQNYQNWECIIVSDGSSDNTEDVTKKWSERDSRFTYLYKENGGVSSARNLGIEMASGEFILPLDADDKISHSYLHKALLEFSISPTLKLVYSKAIKFGGATGNWELPPFSLERLAKDNMIFCSAFFRKIDWELVGGYDTNMNLGLEDWEFWISILKNGGDVKRINEVCFFYRIKKKSRQMDLMPKQKKILFDYLSVKHADFFVKQLGSFLELNKLVIQSNKQYQGKLKSRKFIIDLFCKTFFGFTFFGSKF